MSSCSVVNCDDEIDIGGWCNHHYSGRFESVDTRLNKHSALTSSGCIEWLRFRDGKGYGRIQIGKKAERTHRAAWMVSNNSPIPTGMVVRHTCDNPACINPRHLILGTDVDNVRDMDSRGRRGARRGEEGTSAKLTWPEVKAIRASSASARSLAGQYAVSVSLIYQVRNHTIWKEVG